MATNSDLKEYSREEVGKHNGNGNLWVIIDAKVYDLSKFISLHPGGASVLLERDVAGRDTTEAFFGLHRYEVLERPQYQRLQIGVVAKEKSVIHGRLPGVLSTVPYGEPTSLTPGYFSPYFSENHRQFQRAMREFADTVISPDALVREKDGKRFTQVVADKMAELNLNAMRLGPGKHLKGIKLMNGLVKPEEFDYFHELIITQEIARVSSRGYADGLLTGKVIGLPPVLEFGSEELKAKIVPDVLNGKKFICLAITEARAGSDVMGMRTTAVKSEDGREWIINGTKKWITNGTFADYFTVGCRTGDSFTCILVPRGPGVETKLIRTSYSPTAGTAFITFDNVRVPVENTLGKEGNGLYVILSNFNHERWVICCASARYQRNILEECLKWASQRIVFGKPLSAQPVIRSKLAAMIARTESVQSWLESITYQMCNMNYKQQSDRLAGQIAILKTFCTSSAQDNARDAVQIFGGRGLTSSGMGQFIEQYHRTMIFDSVLGGSEDVMSDLGARQALKLMPKDVRL